MHKELAQLLDRMTSPELTDANLIKWGSPIPSFGNLQSAKLATIGLNPSNREFVDEFGKELDGAYRRFHTLKSLGLTTWQEAENIHYDYILDYCFNYFSRNPYDGWFKKLDHIISGTSFSYYFPSGIACHLDLIPYATFKKWTDLPQYDRHLLLEHSSDFLGHLLNNSEITTIVLNGQTVVDNLEKVAQTELTKVIHKEWTLPRKKTAGVIGYSYEGSIKKIGNVKLKKKIKVLGYNHNIQSSFGVTKNVQNAIRHWISESLI
jgi:hypothetical protein